MSALGYYLRSSIVKKQLMGVTGLMLCGFLLSHLAGNTLLFVGYQAEGTRGRAVLNGKPEIKIHGQQVPVRAAIENISGFSGHADFKEALAWLMGFNRPPLKTFIVHGEPEASSSMAEKISDFLEWNVVIPEFEESFSLP